MLTFCCFFIGASDLFVALIIKDKTKNGPRKESGNVA